MTDMKRQVYGSTLDENPESEEQVFRRLVSYAVAYGKADGYLNNNEAENVTAVLLRDGTVYVTDYEAAWIEDPASVWFVNVPFDWTSYLDPVKAYPNPKRDFKPVID